MVVVVVVAAAAVVVVAAAAVAVAAVVQKVGSSVFCPRAGPSLQTQAPRLQFCSKAVFHCKHRNLGCSFTRDE